MLSSRVKDFSFAKFSKGSLHGSVVILSYGVERVRCSIEGYLAAMPCNHAPVTLKPDGNFRLFNELFSAAADHSALENVRQ